MPDCEFCAIASGETGAAIAIQTERLVVFADHAPIRTGHMQIIPRAHFTSFDDLPPDLAAEIVVLGQRIARVQKRLYGVERVGFVFTGNEIPHVHAHVIPLHAATDVTSLRYFEGLDLTPTGPHRVGLAEQADAAQALADGLRADGIHPAGPAPRAVQS